MTIRSDRPYARRANRGPDASGEPGKRKKNWINYPRAKSRIRWMRWLPSLRLMLLTGFLLTSAVVATIMVIYARTPLPGIADITKSQVTIVYWNDGTEMMRFQEQNRVILPNGQIPQVMKDATIASEDRTFLTNPGISVKGIARAAYNNARGRPLQGGSTLTQQYVKNVLLNTQARTRERKIKEFFIAVKIGRKMDKQEILSQYLNTIYFGRNSYGIEAASQSYFGHPASKLTVTEAAYLAGIINGPELYDPFDGPAAKERAVGRWNHTLGAMVETGKITQAERDKLTFPAILKVKVSASNAGQIGYLRNNIRRALLRLDVTPKLTNADLDRGGLRVYTTYDKRLVALAAQTVKDILPDDVQPTLRVGLATIDPRSGAVLATYGGRDYLSSDQYDNTTQASAQAGSTFKPFALIAGLENGVSLKTEFDGNTPKYFDGYRVSNYRAREQFGMIDLIKATEHSVNTVYVGLNVLVGPEKTQGVAVRAGIPAEAIGSNKANVLGDATVTPLQLAGAYSTIAAGGVQHARFFIQKIDHADGSALYQHKDAPKPVFHADVMADTTYAMQQVIQHGTGTAAKALGRPVAGKTGTSQDSKGAWFAAFTPQMVTTVALSDHPKGSSAQIEVKVDGKSQTGGAYPARIWTAYMKEALGKAKVVDFPEPAWVGGDVKPTATVTSSPTATLTSTPTATPSTSVTPTDTSEVSPSDSPTPSEEPTTTEASPSESPKPTTTKAKPTGGKPTPSGSPSG